MKLDSIFLYSFVLTLKLLRLYTLWWRPKWMDGSSIKMYYYMIMEWLTLVTIYELLLRTILIGKSKALLWYARIILLLTPPPPLYISAARVNTDIEGTKSLEAILNNCHVAINQTSRIQKMCSSHFCDKQRPYDWTHGNIGCGCWGVTGMGGSNILLMNTVDDSYGVGVQFLFVKFHRHVLKNFSWQVQYLQTHLRQPWKNHNQVMLLKTN